MEFFQPPAIKFDLPDATIPWTDHDRCRPNHHRARANDDRSGSNDDGTGPHYYRASGVDDTASSS